MNDSLALVLLLSVALIGNLPLGLLRRASKRWTLPWIIGCDGSVPILWMMRHSLGLPGWVIIPEIALALLGNIYGPRLWLKLRRPRGAGLAVRESA